jgi:hypothetical protein
VDPGYEHWTVDGVARDTAVGLWRDPGEAGSHFAHALDLHNIRCLPLRSDDAFREFLARGDCFDLIVIDGDHSYQQCLADLGNAVACLRPGGLVLVHDAYCFHWPGVAFALDTLCLEEPSLQRVCVPLHPGLALLQKAESSLTIRRATAAEKERVNACRPGEVISPRQANGGSSFLSAMMPLATHLEVQVRRLHLNPLQAQLEEVSRLREQEVSQLQELLQNVLTSTSWRWTYPARLAGRWARGLWSLLRGKKTPKGGRNR